jgi:hypothetical protein
MVQQKSFEQNVASSYLVIMLKLKDNLGEWKLSGDPVGERFKVCGEN